MPCPLATSAARRRSSFVAKRPYAKRYAKSIWASVLSPAFLPRNLRSGFLRLDHLASQVRPASCTRDLVARNDAVVAAVSVCKKNLPVILQEILRSVASPIQGKVEDVVWSFSTTANAYLPTLNGCSQNLCDEEATVTKLSADGSSLVYSTFLGGTSDLDQALAVAVDSLGDAYVTGITASSDFPITSGAFETACPAPDGTPNCGWEPAFVTKLNPAGSALLY